MSIREAKRLRDVLLRQQLFVEQVKAGQIYKFNTFAAKLLETVRDLLIRVPHNSLDGLTKTELRVFIANLRKRQKVAWNQYVSDLINDLETFTKSSKRVNAIVYGTLAFEFGKDESAPLEILSEERADKILAESKNDKTIVPIFGWPALRKGKDADERMWAYVYHEIIPGTGSTLEEFIDTLSLQSQLKIEQVLKQAYANHETVSETIAKIKGSPELNGRNGIIDGISNSAAAVLTTVVQHVAMQTTAAIQSAYFNMYQWVSIMDNRTTPICTKLNRRVFEYGRGPIPPAHIRCRSHIEPYRGNDIPDETLYNWASRQPAAVIAVTFSGAVAAKFANKTITADDVNSFKAVRRIDPDDYESVIGTILIK